MHGRLVQVTSNIFSALVALRKRDEERVLWVDALCINQENIRERSEQAQWMQSIYQRARQTVAWLGDANQYSNHAMDLLEKLRGTQQDIDRFNWPEDMLGWQGSHFDPAFALGEGKDALFDAVSLYLSDLGLTQLIDLSEADWTALENFLTIRPYWTRLWVVQEVANGQKVEIRCESRSMGLDTLKYLPCMNRPLGKKPEYSPEDAAAHIRFRRLITKPFQLVRQRRLTRHPMRNFGMEESSTSFMNPMETFRSFQYTDPRDKVYALLGLTSVDKDMPLPKLDYSKTVSQVYSETVHAIINDNADLSVLCLRKSFEGTLTHEMPSWVPDWTTSWDSAPLIGPGNTPKYAAAAETLPEGPHFNFTPSHDGQPQLKQHPWKYEKANMRTTKSKVSAPFTRLVHQPRSSQSPQVNHRMLFLNGFNFDVVSAMGEAIPDMCLENGNWKRYLVDWEKLLKAFRVYARSGGTVQEINPGFRHPKLGEFLMTLFRGILYVSDAIEDSDDLVPTYVEHYLVWTDRIPADKARVPISPALVGAIFDNEFRDNLRGWKFILTKQK
jgi:hypothetical protein